jgi:ubiquinone/menaquinone biosynthesis C-methylase UbiE
VTIVGNTYDKYGTSNPVARLLMQGFLKQITRLAQQCEPVRVLEVGCGEGHLIAHVVSQLPPLALVAACDVSLDRLAPNLPKSVHFEIASIDKLPYKDGAFDLVLCCEVLEHLERPDVAIAELQRVTSRHLLVSTPNEPLFRILNLLRLAYLRDLGNTPGHLQHFSATSLARLLKARFRIIEIARPLPWIVALTERQRA